LGNASQKVLVIPISARAGRSELLWNAGVLSDTLNGEIISRIASSMPIDTADCHGNQ